MQCSSTETASVVIVYGINFVRKLIYLARGRLFLLHSICLGFPLFPPKCSRVLATHKREAASHLLWTFQYLEIMGPLICEVQLNYVTWKEPDQGPKITVLCRLSGASEGFVLLYKIVSVFGQWSWGRRWMKERYFKGIKEHAGGMHF